MCLYGISYWQKRLDFYDLETHKFFEHEFPFSKPFSSTLESSSQPIALSPVLPLNFDPFI